MTFRLPLTLEDPDDATALTLLSSYYGNPLFGPAAAVGATFDAWDSTRTRSTDTDRFTPDDFVAVSFLSVNVPATAARVFLRDAADSLSDLIREIGPDRDLADEALPLADDWTGWRLMTALRAQPGVGPTKASKLLARKCPRLRPIWDSVIARTTGTEKNLREPLRVALRTDDRALHHRLLRLRETAGLPDAVTVLRVFDVIAWREGKNRGF